MGPRPRLFSMSSKSRHTPSRPVQPAKPAVGPEGAGSAGPGSSSKDDHLLDHVEDVVHVPKGTSPLKFVLMVLLVIFLIVMFAVDPSTIQNTFRGGGPASSFASWDAPSGERVEMSFGDFQDQMRRLEKFRESLGQTLPRERSLELETARYLILDQMSEEAGVRIATSELRDLLAGYVARSFGDTTTFRNYFRSRYKGGVAGFEADFASQMRIQRYLSLLQGLAGTADVEAVKEEWSENDRFKERAFDYVALPVEQMMDAARAELPGDEELKAWFEGLSDFEKRDLEEPQRSRAEIVGFAAGSSGDYEELFARYGEDAESVGPSANSEDTQEEGADESDGDAAAEDASAETPRSYYDSVFTSRFRRPEPDAEGGEEDPLDFAALSGDEETPYLSFDEAAAVCELEAPVYFAMTRWLDELVARQTAGEEIDLAAEAASLGLEYRAADEARSFEEWREAEWGGLFLGSYLRSLEPGGFTSRLLVDEQGLRFARLVERTDAFIPPFEELREEVAEMWVKDRSSELALEALNELRAEFAVAEDDEGDSALESAGDLLGDAAQDLADEVAEELSEASVSDAAKDELDDLVAEIEGLTADDGPDAVSKQHIADRDAFIAAAAARGWTVGRRDWMTQKDSSASLEEGAPAYIRSQIALGFLEQGTLAEPGLDFEKKVAYLVRSDGSRPRDIATMTPLEYKDLTGNKRFASMSQFAEANFAPEALLTKCNLLLDGKTAAEILAGDEDEDPSPAP